jgi:hypothetical protein
LGGLVQSPALSEAIDNLTPADKYYGKDGFDDRDFLFALGLKSPAANSEATPPLTKRKYPGWGREHRA